MTKIQALAEHMMSHAEADSVAPKQLSSESSKGLDSLAEPPLDALICWPC